MKKILFTLSAAFAVFSATAANGYKVTGTAEGTEPGDSVFICEMQGFFSMIPTDTAIVDKDGRFEFDGEFDGAVIRYVLPFHKGKPTTSADFILENADIDMHIFADPEKRHTVKGGPATKMYAEYEAGCKVFDDEIDKPWRVVLDSTATKEAKAAAQHVVDSISAIRNSYTKTFIAANTPSAISDYLYAVYGRMFSKQEQDIILKKMASGHHYYFYNQMMKEKEAEASTAVGKEYKDLAMPNPQGKMIKASDYVKKNKYTLIDFWASWCGPCRAEMPYVIKTYNAFKKKGFEIVGVSFDNNKAAWVKAIKTLKLTWPHMSDLKGWGCAASSLYNVKGIPANVLVDQNGVIVAKNLRGDDLFNKMSELLK